MRKTLHFIKKHYSLHDNRYTVSNKFPTIKYGPVNRDIFMCRLDFTYEGRRDDNAASVASGHENMDTCSTHCDYFCRSNWG